SPSGMERGPGGEATRQLRRRRFGLGLHRARIGAEADRLVGAVAERLVRRVPASAEEDDWFVHGELVSLGVHELDRPFDAVWAVLARSNSYICHCSQASSANIRDDTHQEVYLTD